VKRNRLVATTWVTSGVIVGMLIVSGVAGAKAATFYGPAAEVLSRGPVVITPTALAKIGSTLPKVIYIPAISVRSVVGAVGLQPDGQIVVPLGTGYVSWYDRGPKPGAVGSAVIIGHVDSYKGPGVFFNLKNLRAGNNITVVLANGELLHFKVSEVAKYSKTNFPSQRVYGNHGTRSLQLITCGGEFDHQTGHYESNIVVYSTLVGATN